eukprot:gene8777-6314_t
MATLVQQKTILSTMSDIQAIFGFFKSATGVVMVAVTRSEEVAAINGKKVFVVRDHVLIPIAYKPRITMEETRYRNLIAMTDINNNVFFSYDYPLHRSWQSSVLQRDAWNDEPVRGLDLEASSTRYVWNAHAMAPLLQLSKVNEKVTTEHSQEDARFLSRLFLPFICGYVGECHVTLREAPRSNDDTPSHQSDSNVDGQAATAAEAALSVQYVLISRRSTAFAGTRHLRRGMNVRGDVANDVETEQLLLRSDRPTVASYVQYRGSIPLFWHHYHDFDLLKDGKTQLHVLVDQLTQAVFETGICTRPLQPPAPAPSPDAPVSSDSSSTETDNGPDDGRAVSLAFEDEADLQHGVLRTNCVDCLDRTNLGQFLAGRIALTLQLEALGLSNPPNSEISDVTPPTSSRERYSRRTRKPKTLSKFSSVPFLSDSLLTEINSKVDSFIGGQSEPTTRAADVFNPDNKPAMGESLQPLAGVPANATTKRAAEPSRRSWTPTPTALRTTVSARSAYTIINQRHIRSATAANLQNPGAAGTREHWQLELEYDYLAPSALLAVHMPPLLQREHRNSTSYLRQWWNACSKWGLFSAGPLAEHYRQHPPPPVAAGDTSAPGHDPTPYALMHNVSQQHAARVIAIGDVHGCIEELIDLLRAVELRPGDAVVFLGDLVTKGPQSERVIRLAMDIGAVAVRGNHDEEVCREYRKLEQQQAAMVNLPYLIRSNDLGAAFVHAGVHPQKPLLYQEKHVLLTIRSLDNGVATPRCLVTQPWAADWRGPLTIYYGHDAVRGFQRYPHAVCTDTGCVYGGNLTAVIFPDETVVAVPARRTYLTQRRSVLKRATQWVSAGAGETPMRFVTEEDEDDEEREDAVAETPPPWVDLDGDNDDHATAAAAPQQTIHETPNGGAAT